MRTEANVQQTANARSQWQSAVSPHSPAAHQESEALRFHDIGIQAVAAAVAQLKAKPTGHDGEADSLPVQQGGTEEA